MLALRLALAGVWIGIARESLLDVCALHEQRHTRPRVVVQRTVVIVGNELVQVDVQDRIARQDVPAQQVRLFRRSDDEVPSRETISRERETSAFTLPLPTLLPPAVARSAPS